MSQIPYLFETPVPKYFRLRGLLKNPKNCAFVTWAFEKCSREEKTIPHDGQMLTLKPFQFIFGRDTCSEETGLTEDEVRTQQKRWEKYGFLKKAPNKTPKRFTIYEWVLKAFLKENPQVIPQETPKRPPSNPHKQEQENYRSKEHNNKEAAPRPVVCSVVSSDEEVGATTSYQFLKDLQISQEDKEKLKAEYSEVELAIAVANLKASKRIVVNPIGYIRAAINKGWKPPKTKENPIHLSQAAERLRKLFLEDLEKRKEKIKTKDLVIVDMFDHVDFCGTKVFYEDVEFVAKINNLLIQFNLFSRKSPNIEEVLGVETSEVEEDKILEMPIDPELRNRKMVEKYYKHEELYPIGVGKNEGAILCDISYSTVGLFQETTKKIKFLKFIDPDFDNKWVSIQLAFGIMDGNRVDLPQVSESMAK